MTEYSYVLDTIEDNRKGCTTILISVVVPTFQADATIDELCKRLIFSLSTLTDEFEILLVDDGSSDNTWQRILDCSAKSEHIQGVQLSRNFGQHNAITAGLSISKGDWIVVMDCDLQDRPEEIVKFYKKVLEGFDVVVGLRTEREDAPLKKITSKLFYYIFQKLTGTKFDKNLGNFGIYSRKVIDSILSLPEQHRSFALLALWVGFKRTEIPIVHDSRKTGTSNYKMTQRAALAVDSIISHSNKLLYLLIKIGLILAGSSLVFAIWLIVRFIFLGITSPGWTSTVISIYFTSGAMLAAVGLLGLYLGKVFNETKKRPLFIISLETPTSQNHKNEDL